VGGLFKGFGLGVVFFFWGVFRVGFWWCTLVVSYHDSLAGCEGAEGNWRGRLITKTVERSLLASHRILWFLCNGVIDCLSIGIVFFVGFYVFVVCGVYDSFGCCSPGFVQGVRKVVRAVAVVGLI